MTAAVALLPDSVPAAAAAAVVFASFFTSALTGAFGLGGGLALLAVMSALLPAAAVVPVHGLSQLGSNASRFFLQRRDVDWTIVVWFAAGSAVGSAAGGSIYVALPETALKAAVGAFVLYTVWGPKPQGFAPGSLSFLATGAVGGFLSMFFGATGPITASMLGETRLGRLNIVATHAACMTFQHLLKSIAFGALGFAFHDWAPLLVAVIASGFLGTAFGVRMLKRMPEERFRHGFRIVLTFFGCYLLSGTVLDLVKR
ncbi:MAG: sulfite exporter TauE/SafE family protein [Parvularculaceae bacterium]|nr:sulfite exporter TauE/SafE family protein [Parvularculaceae bacterium]